MKDKKTTSIIIAILSLLIASAMVYGAVKKSESDSEKYKGWKTYENKEAGFSLKYPASFVVYEDKINHPGENEYGKEIIFASKPRPERPGMNIETYVARGGYAVIVDSGKNPKSLNLEKFMKEYFHPNILKNILEAKNKEIKILDGQKALMVIDPPLGETSSLEVYLVTQDKYFFMTLLPYAPKLNQYKEAPKILNLMLESFKLIEKSK